MDRNKLLQELDQNAYQLMHLKSNSLFGKAYPIRQTSNKREFFRLLSSQQVSDNIR